MDIIEVLNKRYSTKEFNPDKKISDEDMVKVKALLQLSASSTNLQPWHFVIASSEEGKKRITNGTPGFLKFNAQKILDASHVVIMCSRTELSDDYMLRLLDQEEADGRFPNEEVKEMVRGARNSFAHTHRYDMKDMQHWLEKQVYLNMGNLLLGVAVLGIDALPMEGIDYKLIDEEFGLREKGFTSIGAVALGYHAESDFNAKTPKSRLPQEEIFTFI